MTCDNFSVGFNAEVYSDECVYDVYDCSRLLMCI